MSTPSPYERALSAIDAAHAEDPNLITTTDEAGNSTSIPYELHYAQRMSFYLDQWLNAPSKSSSTSSSPRIASEPLRLAIRAQHFRRWEVPRSSYPSTKAGYFSWRTQLARRQASLVLQICLDSGVPAAEAERVASLIRKEDLRNDGETQMLEDVACLVFLDDQFEAFGREHDEAKIVDILRKTWKKMSERGRELALGVHMSEDARDLVMKALA